MMNKLFFVFITAFIFIFVNGVYALTASSSSYSVSMFGNGIAAGDANSNNYNSIFLSEVSGTTRNAESPGFRGNIGFFEESSYLRTVSISSYSIAPRSAVVGSTIGFYINALNAEEVWAEINPPNSQVYSLNLVNGQTVNHLPIPSIVGIYQVVFYARSSTGAVASVVDSFVLTQQGSGGGGVGGGSGGGGASRIIERCNYNWDCTPWSVCSEGIQRRTCVNIGTCAENESRPVEEMQCSEALFDISLRLDNLALNNNNLKFNIELAEKLGLEKIDVHLKYSIINSGSYEIFSQIETKAVRGSLSYEKILSGLNLADGDYILRVDALYGNLQRAFAEQKFSVLNGALDKINPGITGFAGAEILFQRMTFSLFLFVVSLLMLITSYIYQRKSNLNKGFNSLSRAVGLDVYTDSGFKVGRVYDIAIKDNMVYGLVVALDKSVPVSYGKALIRYEFVQNIKDVVVVSSRILEHASHDASKQM